MITQATSRDAALLADIHSKSFGAAAWSLAQIQGSLALTTTRGWLSGQSGFILCQTSGDESEILTICVLPEQRRNHFADALLQHFIAATASGSKIFLEVASDNTAARRLYEKHGFTVTGTRPNYYQRDGKAIDGIMYRLTKP